ncbi:TGS domain-containing protein, partial [Anaerotruncus rubiinfantis]
MLKITLKGGVVKEFEPGTTIAEVAKSLGAGLYKAACAGKVNGAVCDLRTPLTADCDLQILTFDDADGKHAFWHSASHLLAQAVMRLYPDTKYTIGPAVENGFYYDFDVEKPFTTEDLAKIEKEMAAIVKTGEEIERFELDVPAAKELMKDQPYKLELIDKHAAEGGPISFYKQGDFTDLCAGPHLLSVSPLKAIKLIQCTGAYWHGDSSLPMLCRVYGIAFPKASELDAYLTMMEEAKKRDHRKLGRELDLFDIYEEGPGFPFFFPKGMVLRNQLESFWRVEHTKRGYQEIRTPLILNEELWHRSGHWDHYK